MNQVVFDKEEFGSKCRAMLDTFSARFPNDRFHYITLRSLERLLAKRDHYMGEPGGWAGGLVYAIAQHRPDFKTPLPFRISPSSPAWADWVGILSYLTPA
jgi:hypothetical protein